MKGKEMAMSKHAVFIIASIILAMGLCLSLGAQKSYAAEGEIKVQGTLNGGCEWKLVEKADGTNELQLGNAASMQVLQKAAPNYGETDEAIDYYFSVKNPDPRSSNYDPEAALKESIEERDGWPWMIDGRDESITSINILGNVSIEGSMRYIFSALPNLTSITGLEKIDTSKVRTMDYLFGFSNRNVGEEHEYVGCEKLTSISIPSSWDTSNVVSLVATFAGCRGLTSLDVSNMNTSNVRRFTGTFGECSSLETITGLDKLDTSKGKKFNRMFYGCANLNTSLDVSNFVTSSAEELQYMFAGCEKLTAINGLSTWDTSNVYFMSGMFQKCRKVTDLDVDNWNMEQVYLTARMFESCNNLNNIDVIISVKVPHSYEKKNRYSLY